jgi:hypothetical protein
VRAALRIIPLFSVVIVSLLLAPAEAAVNQVDGQVVPTMKAKICPFELDKCIQTGLNYGEGINPPNASKGPIDARLDANTGPETYNVPKGSSGTYVQVKFRLLQEGAGFDNIFGWYNVGSPNKRYPVVLSCAGGNRTTYEPPRYTTTAPVKLTGGYEVTVDFQKEYAAGNYKGGQIGFYLITPEGSANDEGAPAAVEYCATDPNDQGTLANSNRPIDDDNRTQSGTEDTNGFGRIYYTESKLNNDGNYVHFLVYSSKKVSTDFYFGFEDLFRGGDNDFDDTMVKIEGLVPTCQASQEVCNGKDDNCNNQIDENVFRNCTTACGSGQEQCKFTNDGNPANDWINCTAPKPTTEQCNGKDDDCNGLVDDKTPQEGQACTNPYSSTCPKGQWKCLNAKYACDAPKPTMESCDGKDNDCDGRIDNIKGSPSKITKLCSTICGYGFQACQFSDDGNAANDWGACNAQLPSTETCDGIDNDCDGVVDDGVPGEGQPCNHPSGNTCQQGKTKCVAGKISCLGATTGGSEICDCKDNDCDGQTDEGEICGGKAKCINCACRISCTGQEFGCPKGYACKNGYCVPDVCAGVTCKGDEKCINGVCVSLCTGVICKDGKICKAGLCVENNCYGKGCLHGQVCYQGQCVPHPCENVTCKPGEFCENGVCKLSCARAICGYGGKCLYGKCVDNPCTGVICSPGVPCIDGICATACQDINCDKELVDKNKRRVCRDGKCVDNPCTTVRCYNPGEWCEDGQCITANTYRGERSRVLPGGGGIGCTVPRGGAPPASPLSTLPVLLLVGVILLAARRVSR